MPSPPKTNPDTPLDGLPLPGAKDGATAPRDVQALHTLSLPLPPSTSPCPFSPTALGLRSTAALGPPRTRSPYSDVAEGDGQAPEAEVAVPPDTPRSSGPLLQPPQQPACPRSPSSPANAAAVLPFLTGTVQSGDAATVCVSPAMSPHPHGPSRGSPHEVSPAARARGGGYVGVNVVRLSSEALRQNAEDLEAVGGGLWDGLWNPQAAVGSPLGGLLWLEGAARSPGVEAAAASSRTYAHDSTVADVAEPEPSLAFETGLAALYDSEGSYARIRGYYQHQYSSRRIYEAECQRLQRNPHPQLLHMLPAGPAVFDLGSLEAPAIGLQCVLPLLDLIRVNTQLTALCLRSNFLSGESLVVLADVLAAHPSIMKLDISNNAAVFKDRETVGQALLSLIQLNAGPPPSATPFLSAPCNVSAICKGVSQCGSVPRGRT